MRRFSSKSAIYTKHTKAKSAVQAQALSTNHAQYWDFSWSKCACKNEVQLTRFRNSIEKEGLAFGKEVDLGNKGSFYYIYDAKRPIGYNLGKPTQYIRVEVTKGSNLFHGHPISEKDYLNYMKKAK